MFEKKFFFVCLFLWNEIQSGFPILFEKVTVINPFCKKKKSTDQYLRFLKTKLLLPIEIIKMKNNRDDAIFSLTMWIKYLG